MWKLPFFMAALGLVGVRALDCEKRQEISPCTCRQEDFSSPVVGAAVPSGRTSRVEKIEVDCDKMESFQNVTSALSGKFTLDQQITLRVSHSELGDISQHGLKELMMSITRLELNYDKLGILDEDVFAGLGRTQFLSLADNEVPSVPRNVLSHLSLLRTLDLSRNKIVLIDVDDFKYNPTIQHLSMAGNAISAMAPGSLPPLLKHLHVGRNSLHSFNHTLRDLNQLEWLLINSNEITSLDGELPASGYNLKMLYAVDNKLTHLPTEFRFLHRLESLFLQHNKIRSLDGTLQKARRLKFLELSYNDLQMLSDEDFLEAEMLEDLELGHNFLKSLGGEKTVNPDGTLSNSALYPLKSLKSLNLTHNELPEFSFSSIRGLKELRLLDLSNNKITKILRKRSPTENLVEDEGEETSGSSIQDMRLQHNELHTIEGSLFLGMKELQRLNLSHNALGPTIGLRDLRGLDSLRVLDLSWNELTTLEDTSEAWLPSLEELNAAHNRLVILSERDFRGFPGLCYVDASSNQISTLKPELVTNTRCTDHGVPDILRIYLQDNPVMCDAGLADLTVALEVNHAKIVGQANCPVPVTTTKAAIETTMPTPTTPTPTIVPASVAQVDTPNNFSFAATLE